MDAQTRCVADAAIATRLRAWLQAWLAARARSGDGVVLGVYWPVRGEPDLREPMADWHRAGHTIALPRVADGGALGFGRWTPATAMHVAQFGIGLPEPFEPVTPALLIVPCVGFDLRGYRLGYGGGHYDRTLAARPVPAIGVAYDGCALARFAAGAHDRAMAAIVTETRTITCR